jgi:arsenite methyltransferase
MVEYLAQRHDLADPGVVAMYDEAPLWSLRFGTLLLENLELARGISVLDVGCGTGFPLFELAQVHGESCQFVGVDVWEQALERARRKLDVYGLKNVRLLQADAAALPLPDASFDLIVSNLGINNFAQPDAVLAECKRVAKPRARLALTTNPTGHMHEFYSVYREVLTELGEARYLDGLAVQEGHRGMRESVCALVERAGFGVSRVIEGSFRLRYLDGSAFFRHYFVGLAFLDGWRGVVEPSDEARVFAALEHRLNEVARRDGALQLTIPTLYVEARLG